MVAGKTEFHNVVILCLSIFSLAFSVFSVGANFEAFTVATAATEDLFTVIERESTIDPTNLNGIVPSNGSGLIELQNVRHIYPTRPDTLIADGLSLSFYPGQTTVLVGATGSGKSSISHLLVRFYDPSKGQIMLNGHDLRHLNLTWLRRRVRLLGQDPVLFDTTIFENIRDGLIGTEYEALDDQNEKLMQLVEQAARLACAHGFIYKLPFGYQTTMGGRGVKLSGGQRQRIALARALIADPKVLILDEATSALENETEVKVLRAVFDDTKSRTIIVAHRLSTLTDADKIVVLDRGTVVEAGTYTELISKDGAFKRLFDAQKQQESERPDRRKSDQAYITSSRSSIEPVTVIVLQDKEKGEIHDCATSGSGFVIDSEQNQATESSEDSIVTLLLFVLRFSKGEIYPLLIGTVCAVVASFEEPVAAILFGKAFTSLSLPAAQSNQI